jgi:hypothetical protein
MRGVRPDVGPSCCCLTGIRTTCSAPLRPKHLLTGICRGGARYLVRLLREETARFSRIDGLQVPNIDLQLGGMSYYAVYRFWMEYVVLIRMFILIHIPQSIM